MLTTFDEAIDFDKQLGTELNQLCIRLSKYHSLALAAIKEHHAFAMDAVEQDYERRLDATKSTGPSSGEVVQGVLPETEQQICILPEGDPQGEFDPAKGCGNTLERVPEDFSASLESYVSTTKKMTSDRFSDKRSAAQSKSSKNQRPTWNRSLEEDEEEDDFFEFPINPKGRNSRASRLKRDMSAKVKKQSGANDNAVKHHNSSELTRWIGIGSTEPALFQKYCSMNDDHGDMTVPARIDLDKLETVKSEETMGREQSQTFSDWIFEKRKIAAAFLRHPFTEFVIAVSILTNSIVVGIEVDWTVRNPKETQLPIGFSIFTYAFNVVFGLEIALRIFVLMGKFFTGNQKGWNFFDLALVIASMVEVVIELLYHAGSDNFSNLRIVRMVRIARILRVLRVARVVRLLVALRLLCVQILSTLRSVFWAMLLLVVILYIFGMLFAQAASEYIAENTTSENNDSLADVEKYWSTVPRSMYTLYKSVTGGVDWEYTTMALSQIHWFWVGTFLVFLSFTVFAVLNTVVGVFCQSAIQTAQSDHENSIRLKLREKDLFRRKIRTLFLDIDASNDGKVTYHELLTHLDDDETVAYLEILGIDPSDTWDLFKLLDKDGSQHVDVEEFIEGCLRLRGPAKAMDIAKVMYENRFIRKQLNLIIGQRSSSSAISSDQSGVISITPYRQ